MTKPGPSVTSGADTQPGSDSLFPSGFGGGGANVRPGGVGTSEIADGSIAAADLNLTSVAGAIAAHSNTWTGTQDFTGATVTGVATGLTRTAVKTSAYTAAAGDLIPVDTTAGNVTVTLPTAPADKAKVTVKHIIQGGTNTVTVACGGSDVLNKTGGNTSATLTLVNQGATYEYQASTHIWTVTGSDLPLTGLNGTYAQIPALATAATVYVSPTGSDASNGRSWGTAKATIPAAITALGATGGTVELGAGTFSVSSTGRVESCTFTASSSTVADASIGSGDVGSYVISPYLRSPAVIATVSAGVSFTITDPLGNAVTPESSGTALSIITVPAVVVPPGVTLRGQGNEWTSDTSAQTGLLNNAGTWITDAGTGITVLCGHPRDAGAANSGQQALGIRLSRFVIKGSSTSLFGLAQINDWSVVVTDVDCVSHGRGGALIAGNANTTRFSDCRFGANGTVGAAVVTGGVVVLKNTPSIPFGPVKFDNCQFTSNFGWGICGTTDLSAATGARSAWLSQGQFNLAKASAVSGSGVHAAVSGDESRTQLNSCVFESADVLCLDVYDAPVTAVACKILATGGSLGALTFAVRVNAAATLEAIGCSFRSSSSYHVQVASTGVFNWRSCSTAGVSTLAADSSGNVLALNTDIGTSGGTGNPPEPMFASPMLARTNETFSRLFINSTSVPVVSQTLNLTYFVPSTSGAVSAVAVTVGGTASGGGATYIGIGIFSVSSAGDLTLLASTTGANAGAFTSTGSTVSLNLSSSPWLTKNRRHAYGLLVNSGSTLPTFVGIAPTSTTLLGVTPELTKVLAGQATMPSSVAFASLASGGAPIYARAV